MAEQRLQQDLAQRLLAWYDASARILPWRSLPGQNADPYHVWLSEVMLQQTTVAAVKDYYLKFIELWPTVEALADAPADDVMKAWAGLGYYARARNLLACARIIAGEHGGRFPETESELLKLPGIGPYTSAAIAAIAFDEPHAAVDGNVERVISRTFAIEAPLPGSKPQIRELAQSLVPVKRTGDFAQAMMDLGATICTPRKPNCLICPWGEDCRARRLGIAEALPRKAPKTKLPHRKGTVYWVERKEGMVLVERRDAKRMLGGMLGLPTTAWDKRISTPNPPIAARFRKSGKTVAHTFTHFHLELQIEQAVVSSTTPAPGDGYRWVAASELEEAGLPSLFMKVVAVMRR